MMKPAQHHPKSKKTDRLMLVGLLVVVGLGGLVALVVPKFVFERSAGEPVAEAQVPAVMYRHPLTGAAMAEPMEILPQVFGVMIDNHVDAWPAAGVEDAFLVIEAPVEAAIPRMLAFFTDETAVEEIGPVRSARPYFLDWNNELDALYAHVGGSDAALDAIATGGTFDLNQYWWGDYFWRARDRVAPHNVLTSTRRLAAFAQMREEAGVAPERLYGVWSFKDAEPSQTGVGVNVVFDEPAYVIGWEYKDGHYVRSQAGEAYVTAGGDSIVADNVAVVVTDVKVIDAVGRRQVRTIGEGRAWVLQDGRTIDAKWRKSSTSERLQFYNAATDAEITMNAGTTWIEVVGSETVITID